MSEDKILCGLSRTHGGKYEWKCVKEIHDGDDTHLFLPFPIAPKTSIQIEPSTKGIENARN